MYNRKNNTHSSQKQRIIQYGFGIRLYAHTVTRDAHTGPTRGVPAWAMGLPMMLGQYPMPSPPPGSAAIAPTGCAHAHVAALAHANPKG